MVKGFRGQPLPSPPEGGSLQTGHSLIMDNNIKTNDNGQQQVQQPTPQYIIVKQQSNAALGYLYTISGKKSYYSNYSAP